MELKVIVIYIFNEIYILDNRNQKEEENENDKRLLKLYETNFEKMEYASKLMKYTQIISIFSFLIFLIVLSIKSSPLGKFKWIYIIIPGIITIISFLFALNTFLLVKNIIDNFENENSSIIKFGNLFSNIILNLIGICFLLFIILISLKLEGFSNLKSDLNLTFIPLYIGIGLTIIFIIFISPALISNKLIFELICISVYLFSSFIFASLICIKVNNNNGLNNKNNLKYAKCFIPFYFSIGTHFTYYSFNFGFFISKGIKLNKLIYHLMIFCGLLFILLGGLITQLKLDNVIANKNHFIQMIFITISYCLFVFEYTLNLFQYGEETENKID